MKKKAVQAAFPHTIPVLIGFLFMGTSYGLLMRSKGFPFWYPVVMSVLIFTGSGQFMAVELLVSMFRPLHALFLTLVVNARYLFYGIPMLDKFKGMGWKKVYLIFGMCDETFSINCTVPPPPDVDKGAFMMAVTVLDHLYWIAGTTLGTLLGSVVRFDTTGLDFVMTALFVVLFVGQWEETKDHRPALTGIVCSVLCLILFGGENFILPAMGLIILCFFLDGKRKGAVS